MTPHYHQDTNGFYHFKIMRNDQMLWEKTFTNWYAGEEASRREINDRIADEIARG